MNLNSLWCLISGHDWSRSYVEDGRRIERCEACSMVRDHVRPVGDDAPRLTQESIDGTAPVSYTSTAQVLDGIMRAERKAKYSAIGAKVKAKHGFPREVKS